MTFGRQSQFQQGHYLRLSITFSTAGVAQAFKAQLPAGAIVTDVFTSVRTAFNGGTTNTIVVGTNSPNYNNLLASGVISPAALGNTDTVNSGTGAPTAATFASDTTVYALYAYSGTAPTAGVMDIVVNYIPNNDG